MRWSSRFSLPCLLFVSLGTGTSLVVSGCVFDPALSPPGSDGRVDRPEPWDASAVGDSQVDGSHVVWDAARQDGRPDRFPVQDAAVWDGQVDGPPVADGSVDAHGQCQGTCTICGALSQSDCAQAQGCTWRQGSCTGTCDACRTFGTDSSCQAQRGCTWQEEWGCRGTCRACSSYTDSSGCNAQDGCSWASAGCSGTPVSCDQLTQSQCSNQPGCAWLASLCAGQCALDADEQTCRAAGCSYRCHGMPGDDDIVCYCTGTCSPNVPRNTCLQAGCTWTASTCAGTPEPCPGRSQADCRLGCVWHDAGCRGTCTRCSSYWDQSRCAGQEGCSWQEVGGSCQGSCVPCDQLSGTQCVAQSGCAWNPAVCTGTCRPCDTFSDRASCEAQPGCSWSQ